MRATRAFNGMSRIALVLAVMVWMVQGCVVTAEKKILVAQDTTAEDQATPPDTTGAEDTFTDETDGGVEPDGIGPAKTAWDIGPEGGSFLFDGGVKLIVPPDAFPQVITVEIGIMGGATTRTGSSRSPLSGSFRTSRTWSSTSRCSWSCPSSTISPQSCRRA